MFEIYNSYGFDCFKFEGYEVVIMKHSKKFCCVNNMNTIHVNKEFMNLDNNTQQFILYHEIGHVYYKHTMSSALAYKLFRIRTKICRILKTAAREEIQADHYAVKKLGKRNALKAIEKTIEMFNTNDLKFRRMIIKLFAR